MMSMKATSNPSAYSLGWIHANQRAYSSTVTVSPAVLGQWLQMVRKTMLYSPQEGQYIPNDTPFI